MFSVDTNVTTWINSFSGTNQYLDHLMLGITTYGVPAIIFTVAMQWWVRKDTSERRHVIVVSGLSFLFGLGINQLILLFVQRLRPYDLGVTHLLIDRSADFSFPSDHATATAAIAFAFLLNGMRREGGIYLFAMLAVTVSRIFVGTHFVSDVLGGIGTGMIAVLIVGKLYVEGSRADRFLTGIL